VKSIVNTYVANTLAVMVWSATVDYSDYSNAHTRHSFPVININSQNYVELKKNFKRNKNAVVHFEI
jgi:hypothetical protein